MGSVAGGAERAEGVGDLLATLRDGAALVADLDRALAGSDLTLDRWRGLRAVADQPGCCMADVIEALVVPSTSATRIVDSLVDLGAVFRAPAADDRRRVTLQLTAHGAHLLRQVEPAVLDAATARAAVSHRGVAAR